MYDINNFAIDHVLRGIMTSTSDGSYMWSVNQITDPTLSITSDTAEVVDALGTTIATFNRGRTAEFSASNSLFDLSLYAAQLGVSKEIATGAAKITVPAFETLVFATGDTSKVLAHVPVANPTALYRLNGDGTLGTIYTADTTASATTFVYTQNSHTITLPTGLTNGTQLFIMYEYESENAVSVTGDAVNFPLAGKFVMEVLGSDVCDPTTLIHAFVIFPNAKLDANVDISFTSDGNHPFTIRANQAYCDAKKALFQIVVPHED